MSLMSLPETRTSLPELFATCREGTESICRLLEVEDHVVQPASFISPPKWHLAHTTWFYDRFVLDKGRHGSCSSHAACTGFLFNSYYKSQGEHWLQAHRGHLSRPTVRDIHEYRRIVTETLLLKMEQGDLTLQQRALVELGMQHEQQHQELLLMDIKYILGMHPQMPAYDAVSLPGTEDTDVAAWRWLDFDGGLRRLGHEQGTGFAFDNEGPRHRVWLEGFQLRDRLVRNGEFLDFICDGGYERPEFWLSDGWDWVRVNQIKAPLYWRSQTDRNERDSWFEYHPGGLRPLAPALPVAHVSYFEAAAYAAWCGARLPTEAELEIAAMQEQAGEGQATRKQAFWAPGRALLPAVGRACDAMENGLLWQWTQSAYDAYPGYTAGPGALAEYNGKFMSGQQVLRGGCIATPAGHWRATYRNFYRPGDRWCFTGIRLARNAS